MDSSAPLSEAQAARSIADAAASISYVEESLAAEAPRGSSIRRELHLGPDGSTEESSTRFRVELDSGDGVLDHDYRVVIGTAPPSVMVLHGNSDGGAAGGLRPWRGTLIELSHMQYFGLPPLPRDAVRSSPEHHRAWVLLLSSRPSGSCYERLRSWREMQPVPSDS